MTEQQDTEVLNSIRDTKKKVLAMGGPKAAALEGVLWNLFERINRVDTTGMQDEED